MPRPFIISENCHFLSFISWHIYRVECYLQLGNIQKGAEQKNIYNFSGQFGDYSTKNLDIE